MSLGMVRPRTPLDRRLGAILLIGVAGGCMQQSAQPGPPTGPSELGLSLTLAANPDVLPLDGVSRSLIGILARDPSGQPVDNLEIGLQIGTAAGLEDFGRLSSRRVVTGEAGRAVVTYTVPGDDVRTARTAGPEDVVTIWVTPLGDNAANAVARAVTIRVVPAGTVLLPFDARVGFTLVPPIPAVFNEILFTTAWPDETTLDCVRDPAGIITSYSWDFGDGRTGRGATVGHRYEIAETYLVTLTITDDHGRSASVTRSVVVRGGTPPTAWPIVSPSDPTVGDEVFFNASGSTAASGRTIVSYSWEFGDGQGVSTVSSSHRYRAPGTYIVVLEVTDDRGQSGTATTQLVVDPLSSNADGGRQTVTVMP